MVTVRCFWCGNEFEAKTLRSKTLRSCFCSNACKKAYYYEKARREGKNVNPSVDVPRPCKYCGKDFLPTKNTQKFCSASCRIKYDKENYKRSALENKYDALPEHKPQPKPKRSISEIVKLALEKHMSYGKYVDSQRC